MIWTRRAEPPEETPDWATDSLTGLIPPRALPATQETLPPPALVGAAPIPATLLALEPPPRVPATRVSPVRVAIYGLLGLVVLGAAASLLMRRATTSPSVPVVGPLRAAVSASTERPARPRAFARSVRNPTTKAAAAAFARGDYAEALAQYRALSLLYPDDVAYQKLIRVLERRLTPKLGQ